jgi:hypothetical protein
VELVSFFLDPVILTCHSFAFNALLSTWTICLSLVPFPAPVVGALTQDLPDFRADFGLAVSLVVGALGGMYNAKMLARATRDFGSSRLWLPFLDSVCKHDINLIAGCWSWMESPTGFPNI